MRINEYLPTIPVAFHSNIILAIDRVRISTIVTKSANRQQQRRQPQRQQQQQTGAAGPRDTASQGNLYSGALKTTRKHKIIYKKLEIYIFLCYIMLYDPNIHIGGQFSFTFFLKRK